VKKIALSALALVIGALSQAQGGFALKSGDRVVFYGDSITDNSFYTKFAELFVRLRYPDLDVKFVNAGVGGDRVSGGWMGPVDERLSRDLFSRKPTVITVMLGMNDGSYQAAKPEIENAYESGYRHIIDRFKKEAPNARVFLIEPSPFDDVTRAPGWNPGYNSVMRTMSDFVADLAKLNGYAAVDFNTPVVSMLEKAKAANPDQAAKIIPDRVHPGPAGHLVMAEQLLLSWGALPTVSNVTIDANSGRISAMSAKISGLSTTGNVSWTQTDAALPFPSDRKDANVALALNSGDFDQKLNQEMLTVKGLKSGNYSLNIDGKSVGSFSADQLATGINLATLETPMIVQARTVWSAVEQRTNITYNAWRQMEFGLGWAAGTKRDAAVKAVYDLSDDLSARARALAKPVPHKFELVPQ
jgi:lysophospholipase L1-like esterase